MENWIWFGYPKHFCGASKCYFRLATKVGSVIVSTVGDYRADGPDKKPIEIGCDRQFETMVFKAKEAECGCCDWECDIGEEVDFAGYQTPREAEKGHLEMCKKWNER